MKGLALGYRGPRGFINPPARPLTLPARRQAAEAAQAALQEYRGTTRLSDHGAGLVALALLGARVIR